MAISECRRDNSINYQRIYALKDDFSHLYKETTLLKLVHTLARPLRNQTAPPQLNSAFNFTSQLNLVDGTYRQLYRRQQHSRRFKLAFFSSKLTFRTTGPVSRRLTLNLGLRWQLMPPIASWPEATQRSSIRRLL